VCYKEVTALLAGGRLLLFYDLNDQTGQADKYNAKLKQFLIGNHIDHPLSFDQGQEVSPLKRGKPPTIISTGSTMGYFSILGQKKLPQKSLFRIYEIFSLLIAFVFAVSIKMYK